MSHRIGLNIPVPQMLPVTGSWVFPFALYQFFLSGRVSQERFRNQKSLDYHANSTTSSENDRLFQAIRAHNNFLETVPLALVVAGIAELNGVKRSVLNYAFAALFAARIAHAEFGLMLDGGRGKGRPIGHLTTQAFIAGIAGYSAWLVKEYWGF